MTQDYQNMMDIFLMFGPTASGKTGFAVDLAKTLGREETIIINADSLQIYKGLPIITACPSADEKEGIEHKLFEYLEPGTDFSVAHWFEAAEQSLREARDKAQKVIIVGGTGFYFKSLICGLPATPPADLNVRARLQGEQEAIGQAAFFERLQQKDPLMAAKLERGDRQRSLRAMEVLEATGQSLAVWQDKPARALDLACHFHYINLMPKRDWLYERCNKRFNMMIEAGALAEVEAFIKTYGHDDYALCRKAIGFGELKAYKDGEISLERAKDKATQRTRRYAKRQTTWARHQMSEENLKAFVKSFHQLDEQDYYNEKARGQIIKTLAGLARA